MCTPTDTLWKPGVHWRNFIEEIKYVELKQQTQQIIGPYIDCLTVVAIMSVYMLFYERHRGGVYSTLESGVTLSWASFEW